MKNQTGIHGQSRSELSIPLPFRKAKMAALAALGLLLAGTAWAQKPPESPPQCPSVHTDLRVNGLEYRFDHQEWQIKFNDCPQGTTCEVQLSLENIGSAAIPMVALSLDRDVFYDDYLILEHGCANQILAPGASCAIFLRYEMPVSVARTNPGKLVVEVAKNRLQGGVDVTSVDFSPSPVNLSGPDAVKIAVCAEDDAPGSDLCE